ncbi:hypothetical protein N7528_006278 [Penicillium herquei]|nr:hypothetical protein N7528_006278 [Penicillium herquei]
MGIGIIGAGCGIGKALEAGQLHGTNRIISLVIFNTTEMWLVQIASAAAPLWPLVSHITEKWKPSNDSMMPPDHPIHEGLGDRSATGNPPNVREIGASFQRQRNFGQPEGDLLASSSTEGISMTRSLSIHREQV